jgi:hypothetical protein
MEQHSNNWDHYLEAVYEAFALDFLASMPTYFERRFALKRHPLLQGKEATFWHITSQGQVEDERPPDLRRCERIVWIRPMINRSGSRLEKRARKKHPRADIFTRFQLPGCLRRQRVQWLHNALDSLPRRT